MANYMTELKCGIPEEIIRGKLMDFIDSQSASGIIRIDLILENSICAGFTVYQIDTIESDWCKRPGWGFIREFYVIPACRNQGIGKNLAEHTARQLRNWGAEHLYLTSTEAASFWQACGWRLTEEVCSNGQYILEK
jgi:GNAT superfamily N-acetyltransferase